jgi:hypothetical protein
VYLGFEDQSFGIHQQVLLPAVELLASVVAPLLIAYPVVFDDWESATPALGCGFLPKHVRKRSRSTALSFSKVPLILHSRK